MQVRCWGSRGSLPVSGPQYLKYGGDTTCVEVRSAGGHVVVIDAGTGIRALGNQLVERNIKNFDMVFTHVHRDHIMGFPFLSPLFQKGTTITIRGCAHGRRGFRDVLTGSLKAPYFPVGPEVFKARLSVRTITSPRFTVGSMLVRTIPLSHPNGGVGLRFEEHGKAFVFLTDNELANRHNGGLSFDEYAAFSHNADLLIHDAEYTAKDYRAHRFFGHSRYPDTVKLAVKAGARRLGLFHHNRERTDTEIDGIVEDARKIAEKRRSDVACFAIGTGFEMTL